MSFNQRLTGWQTGLDQAYDEALDAGDRDAREVEALEDLILSDNELFERLAVGFCRWTTTFGYPVKVTFLEWATEKLRRERTPEHDHAWEEKPSNAEYWNWNDDRV